MMKLSEEQKSLLTFYSGGKTRIIRSMKMTIEEFKTTGEEPEIVELLEDIVVKLQNCTNKEFFEMKKERLIDTEDEEAAILDDGGGAEDVGTAAEALTTN